MDDSVFDHITRYLAYGRSRRRIVGSLVAGALAGVASRARPRPAAALRRAICIPIQCGAGCCSHWCHCDCPCEKPKVAGIAGAGAVRLETGVAHFSLFASIISDLKGSEPAMAEMAIARVQWEDPDADLTFESLHADYYGPVEGIEGGREVIGWTQVNGEGQYPFILQAVAAEPRGTGPETISFRAGDAILDDPATAGVALEPTGFTYAADGELVGGDLQLLSFNPGDTSG